jgi:hypothetical protein
VSRRWLAVLVFAAVLPASSARAVDTEWVARWRQDLALARDTLSQMHPNLFHSVTRAEWNRELDSLAARLPRLEHHEIVVELARIVARIGDGHTRLTMPFDSTAGFFTGHSSTAPPLIPGLVFRHLPVRLYEFADGLFVVRATPDHADLLGGKVVELGNQPIERAIALVAPTVQRDNDQQVRDLLPRWLMVPEILHARRVAPERTRVRIVVESADGGRREAWLAPVPLGMWPEWREARTIRGDPPLADRFPSRRHWQVRIGPGSVLYARYREVLDDGGRTVSAFADSVFGGMRGTDRLVLDIRGNVGGNGFLNRPVLHGAIATPALRRPGGLFVLADRGTFSAAMSLLADLETHTPAVIVGEKSGARPNGYGDSRRLRLPRTGLTIRVSSLYWQVTDPRDERDGIAPHIALEPKFADWQAGRDPALDSALALAGAKGSDPTGEWTGTVTLDHQRLPMSIMVAREGTRASVRLDSAELDAKDAAMSDVGFERGELSFAYRGSGPPWEFTGRAAGETMIGVVRFQGSVLPFVLARKRSG